MQNPYTKLTTDKFWSSGVASLVNTASVLSIDTLGQLLESSSVVVSGGSCFGQYIGVELGKRDANYLKSKYSGKRIESFGLGNIYTIKQWRQWLEFCLGKRTWNDLCAFQHNGAWYDYLLPHLGVFDSKAAIFQNRENIKHEIHEYLAKANYLVFTIGLTETWLNSTGDVYPCCPGTLVGEFDGHQHHFHNCSYGEILRDLYIVDELVNEINTSLRIVYTVSPVPLTATASDSHVLIANTYSKSIIRGAIGEFCSNSKRAKYFPSFELINHHQKSDCRFQDNLRSISADGVNYVMQHAFGEQYASEYTDTENCLDTQEKEKSENNKYVAVGETCDLISSESKSIEAICEEHLLESHARLINSKPSESRIVLAGDCHMGLLASGFGENGVDVKGGMIMHGSAFTDYKFEICNERILLPSEHKKSEDLWFSLHDQLRELNGDCDIITNICFHTHRTIVRIANHFNSYVITIEDIAEYFEQFYQPQIYVLSQLTKYGKVWIVEDPAFHAFLNGGDTASLIRNKNFQQYCNYMRLLAQEFGIEYINPCDTAMQKAMKDGFAVKELIQSDGFMGTDIYYKYCANIINGKILETQTLSAYKEVA